MCSGVFFMPSMCHWSSCLAHATRLRRLMKAQRNLSAEGIGSVEAAEELLRDIQQRAGSEEVLDHRLVGEALAELIPAVFGLSMLPRVRESDELMTQRLIREAAQHQPEDEETICGKACPLLRCEDVSRR